MNAHLLNLLSLAAADLSRELGPGYLVAFDYGAQVRHGELSETGSLCIYLDGKPLHAVLQLFTSLLDGTPAESVAKIIAHAYEWLAVGRSLGAKEAA